MGIVRVYAAYLLVVVLSVATFLVWRNCAQLLVGVLDIDSAARPFWYALSVVVIVIALFITDLAAEPYLRQGERKGQLGRRFRRLLIPLAAILVAGIVAQEIIL